MKILSPEQMKLADRETIRTKGIASIALMERASQAVFDQLKKDFVVPETSFMVICGPGNNGGDGLAVGRILHTAGASVSIYLLENDAYSPDNSTNQTRLAEKGLPINKIKPNDVIAVPQGAILIDALFGYGLSRPLSSEWTPLVQSINDAPNTVVAIDMPSGLIADKHTDKKNHPVVRADRTYTFQTPKLAQLLPDNASHVGHMEILDIGLSQQAIQACKTECYYITVEDMQPLIPHPSRFSHKGTFGHALIMGGSFGKIGAVVLSSRAALRTGCGLLSAYVPRCGYTILQSAFPEAMVLTDEFTDSLSTVPDNLSSYAAIGLGIGMGTSAEAQNVLHGLLLRIAKEDKKPALVLDADALNILAIHPEWLSLLPSGCILTPHPKELERLIGSWSNDFEKLEKVVSFTKAHQAIVIIKGANTNTVFPDGKMHFNSTGNWGMATGGSGDVLTGMLASLLAQGFSPQTAAISGVYLHGLAGDLATKRIHPHSLIASDIVGHISDAWTYICRDARLCVST